jgi:hypothetical protein
MGRDRKGGVWGATHAHQRSPAGGRTAAGTVWVSVCACRVRVRVCGRQGGGGSLRGVTGLFFSDL